MEKLKSIFKLKFIQEMPRENKMAYLVSVGMGVGAGVLVTIIPNFFSHGTGLENNIFTFSIFVPIPILSIVLLSVLFKKFPNVWNNIKVRIICSVILLVVYMYSFCFILLAMSGDMLYKVLFLPIYIFFGAMIIFLNPTQSLLLPFIYSGTFIIIAAYLATKGITNLPKRIILFLVVCFLICMATEIPLIMAYMSTFS